VRKFRTIAEDHLASGGSAPELAEALHRLGDRGTGTDDDAPRHFPAFETFATLLELWYSDAAWLVAGEPRALKPTGKAGFAGLCRALGVAKQAASLASLGVSLGILKTTTTGELLPAHRTALVNRPSPMLLDLASVGMAAWQAAMRHNVQPGTTEANRWIDRGIYHAAIPASLERAYHVMVRKAGTDFVDRVDNWLQAHRASPTARDRRLVCAHVFAATEDAPGGGKARGKR